MKKCSFQQMPLWIYDQKFKESSMNKRSFQHVSLNFVLDKKFKETSMNKNRFKQMALWI